MNSTSKKVDNTRLLRGSTAEELNAVYGGAVYEGLWNKDCQCGVFIGPGGISWRTADGELGKVPFKQ